MSRILEVLNRDSKATLLNGIAGELVEEFGEGTEEAFLAKKIALKAAINMNPEAKRLFEEEVAAAKNQTKGK